MDLSGFVETHVTGYFVNMEGEVYSAKSKKMLKPSKRNGYLLVRLYWDEKPKGRDYFVHRLVASAFIPKVDGFDYVNHKDCVRSNNNVNNLEWCSYLTNNQHRMKTEGYVSSKEHNKKYRKLTDEQVKEVLKIRRNTKATLKEIGAMFGVSYATISYIVNGNYYKELTT
jgi:hypothetical protein